MKPDKSLHQLIKTLSKTEKTYYKKFSSRHSKNGSSGIEMFDAIERAGEHYNEENIKHQLKELIPEDQFPVIKNYLYGNVLKSLSLYHLESNESIKLTSIINNAGLLYKRGLLKQSLKQLAKARILASELKDDVKLLDILNLERKTLRAISSLNSSSQLLRESYKEEEEALERIRITSRYRKHFDELVIFLTGKGISHENEINKFLDKLLSGKYLKDLSYAKTDYSKVVYHLIHALGRFFRGSNKESLYHSKKLIEVCEGSLNGKYLYGYEYILGMQQIVTCYRLMNSDKEADKYERIIFTQIDDILRNYPQRVKDFLLSRALISEVNELMRHKRYEEGREKLEQLIKLIPDDPYRDEKVVVNYVAAVNCYFTGDKEKALSHVNTIFNSKGLELRIDLQAAARILNLILHYELGNLSNLKHFIRSVYNYLKKTNRLSEAEITVLDFIKNISKTEDSDERRRLSKKVKMDIDSIKSKKNFSETVNLDFFMIWIDRKFSEFNNQYRKVNFVNKSAK